MSVIKRCDEVDVKGNKINVTEGKMIYLQYLLTVFEKGKEMLSSIEDGLYSFFTEILPLSSTGLTFSISHLEKGL